MINKNKRIVHEIVHPVFENYEICYMVIMFIENDKIVKVSWVELKRNFISFDDTNPNPNVFYAYSSN